MPEVRLSQEEEAVILRVLPILYQLRATAAADELRRILISYGTSYMPGGMF